MKNWIFLVGMVLSLGSYAGNVVVEVTNEKNISTDLKTAYYWAFYGDYSKDSRVLGEVLSRLADIDSRIYNVTKVESYSYYKTLVDRQGGPQLLLAQLGGKRLLAAELMGLNSEVDAFVAAASKLNPQFAASLTLLVSEFNIPGSLVKARQFARPSNPADIEKCLVSCGIYFLGLEKNPILFPSLQRNIPMTNAEISKHQQQITSLFPQYSKGNGEPLQLRRGVDPRVASISNQCVSACTSDIFEGLLAGGPAGASIGGLPGAVAGGFVGISVGVLKCSTSRDCGVSRETEISAEKAAQLKAENDRREEKLRDARLKNEEREQMEEQRRNREQEKQKRDSERAQKNEQKIKESFEKKPNGKKKEDSKVECDKIKQCDETMTAFKVPEGYSEKSQGNIEEIGQQKDWAILRAKDTGDAKEFDLSSDKNERDSTPWPEWTIDSKGDGYITDTRGNILTETDLSGTPMPGSDDNQYDFDFSGQGRKANPIVPVIPGKLGGW